jgi:hypothetical protein
MNRAAELSDVDERYKAQAERYLSETQRILRQLRQERQRNDRRRAKSASVLQEVKHILRAA